MAEVISTRLVDLIQRNADRLTKAWLADVKQRPETPTTTAIPTTCSTGASTRCTRTWESGSPGRPPSKRSPASTPPRPPALRRGIRPSEVMEALILTRRHLWLLS